MENECLYYAEETEEAKASKVFGKKKLKICLFSSIDNEN